jgi:hypothetical protein
MGGLCSKETDHFDTPGRTLGGGSAGQVQPSRARVPGAAKPKVTGPGRQLGGTGQTGVSEPGDARSAAAKAAEVSVE